VATPAENLCDDETASLTDAARAAGFADAAHMTRTFRRMLGISPSSLAAD
jgi:AraC-like DNA-binding protein